MKKKATAKAASATLGVLLAGFLLLWTLGSCPGLDDPAAVSDTTDPSDPPIILDGTVSEENGRLYLKMPLPPTETAVGRNVYTQANGAASVDQFIGDGITARVLDKNMLPKALTYYELILREKHVSSDTPRYVQDSANTSNGEGFLQVPVEAGKTYDILLLAGTLYGSSKTLLGSAYYPSKLIEPGRNTVSLTLSKLVTNLQFPAEGSDHTKIKALAADLRSACYNWGDYLGIPTLSFLQTDFNNTTAVQDGSNDDAIRAHLAAAEAGYRTIAQHGIALLKSGIVLPRRSAQCELKGCLEKVAAKWRDARERITALLEQDPVARTTTTIDEIQAALDATKLATHDGNGGTPDLWDIANVIANFSPFYYRVYKGSGDVLTIRVGQQTGARKIIMRATFEKDAANHVGIQPLIDSLDPRASPYPRINNFINLAAHKAFLRNNSAAVPGETAFLDQEIAGGAPAVSTTGITFTYEALIPSVDCNALMYFTMQYYPFGNPFPTVSDTISAFGLPWNIRHGIKDQEAGYVAPSSGSVYSIGGAIRVIAGEGAGADEEDAYLNVLLQ